MSNMYALIRNNNVLQIVELSEEQYVVMIKNYDSIVDVSNMSPAPEVGWVLRGNQLQPQTLAERALSQQNHQRQFGEQLSKELVDLVGARNLELSFSGNTPNVSGMLTALGGVLSLMQTGALKTARTIIAAYAPSFPLHSDIMAEAIQKITAFLQTNGWDD